MRYWPALLATLCALTASGPSIGAAGSETPAGARDGGAGTVPAAASMAADGDRILVLRAEGGKFREAMDGLVQELGREIEVEEKLIGPGTGMPEVAAAVAALRPRAVILMDNHAIRLYAELQAGWRDAQAFPPSIALMAVRVDKAILGMKRVTGIFYEVPGVTILVNLRSILDEPVRKVGVIHRGAMEDFVRESARWCAAENIELVPYPIPGQGDDVAKAVRTGVRRLWRKDAVDALWVLNDNFYLTPEIIRDGWLPALERFEKPVLVGVENFVSTGIKFGTFAVLPDHYGLGAQAAGLVTRLQEDGWKAGDEPSVRQPLAITKLLNLRLARKYSRVNDARLMEIDRVVK